MWAYKLLRTKYFHGVSSGNQHPYLLKSRYGKVRELLVLRLPEIPEPILIDQAMAHMAALGRVNHAGNAA